MTDKKNPPYLTKANVEKYLTNFTTAAEMLGCSRQAVAQYVERGDLEVVCPGSTRLVWVHEIVDLASRLRIPGRKPVKPEHVKRRVKRVEEKRRIEQKAIERVLALHRHRDGDIRRVTAGYAKLIKKAGSYSEKTALRQRRTRDIAAYRKEYARMIKEVRVVRTAMRRKT